MPSLCRAVLAAGAPGSPRLALGRARGPVPQRAGALPSVTLDHTVRRSSSNNPAQGQPRRGVRRAGHPPARLPSVVAPGRRAEG